MILTERWSRLASGEPTAVAFAGDEVVIGDTSGLVVRADRAGKVLSERPLPAPIHALSASMDGRLIAVACAEGELVLLEGDRVVFRKSPGLYLTMTRFGPGGEYVLALAPSGEGVFFNRYGREMGRLGVPDGADSFVILPRGGQIVTANCEGLIQCFTPWGKPVWQTDLQMDSGKIACDEKGDLLLVPLNVYGATALTVDGASVGAYDVGESVGSASCDALGKVILLATSRNRLVLLDRSAAVLTSEKFPAEVREVALSPDGGSALVTTASGYTHLLTISDQSSAPMLELGSTGAGPMGGAHLFRRRVFSPYYILMPPRVEFGPEDSFVTVAGGGGRAVTFDLEGGQIDERRFEGSLLDLHTASSGTVRIVTTKRVIAFRPGERDGSTSFEPGAELYQVSQSEGAPTVALSETGDLYGINEEGTEAEHLFTLPADQTGSICVAPGSIAVAMKSGDVLIHSHEGEVIGRSGPWPGRPRILAAGAEGYLIAVEKLILLLRPDGTEGWRYHLATPPRYGVAVPGAFLVVDEPGAAFSATTSGVVRRTFAVGKGRVVPYPDSGDGPGFLKWDGNLLTAIHPDGRPRWRSRLSDDVAYARPSADGRLAGIISGLDLTVYSLTRDPRAGRDAAEASRFLEFADG